MKSFTRITLLSCFLAMFVFGDLAVGQRQRRNTARPNSSALLDRADEIAARMSEIGTQFVVTETPKRFDLPILKETVKISNQSGAKLVADFYATSEKANAALSPPTMVATFSALAQLGKGKTKEELQKLLSLDGTEKTSFGNLEKYLMQSFELFLDAEGLALLEKMQNENNTENFESLMKLLIQNESKKLGEEYKRLEKELQALGGQLEEFLNPIGMPLSESLPSVPGGAYNSVGYLLLNRQYDTPSEAKQKVYLEQFGTQLETTDFSKAGLQKYNDKIAKIVDDFRDFGGSDGDVIKAQDQSIVVCSAMKLDFVWGFIMDQEERPFNFDSGRKNFNFLKGDLQVRNITVNNKIGYSFPLGLTDMMLVKCRNGVELKQLAKTIASEGIKIETAGIRLRTVGLYLPYVGFQTKFNFAKYAESKGLSTPFTAGQAEYALSDDITIPYPCSDAKVESLFQVDEMGVLLKQITTANMPFPIARNQRVREKIIIDSPYLMILSERNLGTILGMAFIANPVFDDGEEESRQLDDLNPDDETNLGFGNAPSNRFEENVPSTTTRRMSLERGDIILEVNGERIVESGDLSSAVNRSPQTMYLTVRDRRNGNIVKFVTTLNSSRPRLGVTGQPQSGGGARITQVNRNSPATQCYVVE